MQRRVAIRFNRLNPFMPSGILYLNPLDRSISYIKGIWLVFIIIIFVEISEFNANSVDPDQTPRSVASDLGLHYLLMSLLLDARLKLVKVKLYTFRRDNSFKMFLFPSEK